jgi:hypothetical protein
MKPNSLLLRQVHPNFFPDGQLSSQAFFPFPKDKGKLSVYDDDIITAEQSFIHYTKDLQFSSIGVWGITNNEVVTIGLTSKSDPLPRSPAHALINFNTTSDKEYRKIAKKLKIFAMNRGRLYP